MNKKDNLLFFGSDFQVGLTTALSEQILELNNLSEINLYCVSSEKEMEKGLHQKLQSNNVQMTIIRDLDVHKHFKQLANAVEQIIRKKNITHVNVHNNWQLALVSYIKYKRIVSGNFKIIYTIHGYRHNSLIKSFLAIAVIGIALFLFADRVISMSSYVSNKFWFIRYKTDLVFYVMNKPEFVKQENKIYTSPLKMVFPAQFRKGKGQNILIEAVYEYIKKTNDISVRLYLPGDGLLLEQCKYRVNQMNLENNVIFPGKLPHKDVISLYEKSNIALVSSNVETYGRCIAEPFTLGRCVITKRTGVALDIIENNKNGIFFSSGKDLVDILIELHNNPRKIEIIANNAFKDKIVFSTQSVINTYLASIRKS